MDVLEQSIFTYYMTTGDNIPDGFTNIINVGSYKVCLNSRTGFTNVIADTSQCLIIGVATCLSDTSNLSLDEYVSNRLSSIEDFLDAEYYLGGKYVCIVKIGESIYVIGDATCSIPIFYTTHNDSIECSSNGYLIACMNGFKMDSNLYAVREGGDDARTMPSNYTVWKEIKRLLPNHSLDFDTYQTKRIIISKSSIYPISAKEAAANTAPYISRLAEFYKRKYQIACPLTSGRDSRVVLSVLGFSNEIPVYTMKHDYFSDTMPDIVYPNEISKLFGLSYSIINDVNPSEKTKSVFNDFMGAYNYNDRTLMLANTIKCNFGDYAVINGDIIGQVGKCSLHRDISIKFATAGYFRCKLHNYTRFAKKALRDWIQEIKKSGECENLFDLFSIENRMGVWAANENEVYNAIGQVYLNIFNSRCIIYNWTHVDRKERKLSKIHIELIKMFNPSLLEVPFEPSGFFERLSKYNGATYLVASYIKYYAEHIKKILCIK